MCTGIRFNDDNGNFYFGRNLDWAFDFGQSVVVAPRNFKYNSPFQGEQILRHGAVIGMAIVEENIPLYFDCAAEDGLAVAGLNFPLCAVYEEAPLEGKTNIAAYEFPLWLTANFKTVEEAKTALRNIAIVAKKVNEKYPVSYLHWLVADKNASIVVEYTKNGMEIFDNPVDVLTNQPGYAWHAENLRNFLNLDNKMPDSVTWRTASLTPFGSGALMHGLPGGAHSSSRFVRSAFCNTHYPMKHTETENIARLFHTLAKTAMTEGEALMSDGRFEYTTYTGGYSSATKTYYFNTYHNPAIRAVSLPKQNLDSANLITFSTSQA